MRSHTSIKVNAWNATLLLWCAMAMTNGYWTVIATETINAEDWRERRDVERKSIVCEVKEDLRYMDVMCIDMSIKKSLRLKFDTHKHIIFPSPKNSCRYKPLTWSTRWNEIAVTYKTFTPLSKNIWETLHTAEWKFCCWN